MGLTGAALLRATVLAASLGAVATSAGDGIEATSFGAVPLNDLRVGDCLVSLGDQAELATLDRVTCSDPHRGQVFAVVQVSEHAYSRSLLAREGRDTCGQEIRATAPYALEDERTEVAWLQPVARGWRKGDRVLTCLLVTDAPRIGSNIAYFSEHLTAS